MKIKDGFNGKATLLKFQLDDDRIQLWIHQTGLLDRLGLSVDTLSYLTIDEILLLKDEINMVLRERLGL